MKPHVLIASLVASVGSMGCANEVIVGNGGSGSSQQGATSGSSMTSASGDLVGGPGQPPGPPGGPKADSSAPVAVAITKIHFGTETPAGMLSVTAWEDYGSNLDGQVTTTDFSQHCKPNSNAAPKD